MYRDEDRQETIARVLSLGLPENQWRALLEVEPEPIAWLRRQIRERLDAAGSPDRRAAADASVCGPGRLS